MKKTFVVSPSMFCNNDCLMCEKYKTTTNYDFSFDEFIAGIEKKLPAGSKKDYKAVIGGGEPTQYKRIVEIVRFLRLNGFEEIAMLTNGRNLRNLELLDSILDEGVNSFLISLHSHTPKTTKKITQRKECFNESINGLKNVLNRKQTKNLKVNISHVIQSYNYKSLDEFARFISQFKIDTLILTYIETHNDKLMVDFSELRPHLRECADLLIENNIDFVINNLPPCQFIGYEQHYFDKNKLDNSISGINTKLVEKKVKSSTIRQMSGQYEYSSKCLKCAYKSICLGILKTYYSRFDDSSIEPVSYYEAKRVHSNLEIKSKICF